MAYTVPRVEITQEFLQTPSLVNNPLSAFIFGPNYTPIRYDVAAEKTNSLIGDYNTAGLGPVTYPWVATNGGTVDNTAAHLTAYLENVFACYFSASVSPKGSVGGSIVAPVESDAATPISSGTDKYYTNKVQATALRFAPSVSVSGVATSRSACFTNRDVKVGDWVAVNGTCGTTGKITIFTEIVAIETSGSPNNYVNVLVTADRLWDVKGGSDANLLDPENGDTVISLYFRKALVEMPDTFFTTACTTTTVSVQAASNAASKLTEDGLIDTNANGAAALFTIGMPTAGTVKTVATSVGKLYVSYRVLRTDNATQIGSLSDTSQVEATLGAVTPENPLAQGVYDALLNAGGVSVYYMATPTDDLSGYNAVLTQAKRSSSVYGLVPLTFDSEVQDAVIAHVNAMSEASQAKWRKAWICQLPPTEEILTGYAYAAVGGNYWVVNGATAADPQTGTADTFLTVKSSTDPVDPKFTTGGVRVNDLVRIYAGSTPSGTYTDYVIARVVGHDTLVTAKAMTTSDGKAIQIIRTLSHTDQIDRIGTAAGNNRRVNAVFPAYCGTNGVTKEGYFLAAALASLRSSSLPHRPLTNVEVLGFDDVSDTLVTYTSDELDRLASYGYWIVTQDTPGGTVYTRHQLTTAGFTETGDDPKFSEDSVTTNVDSISYGLQRALAPYIGKYNVNPATVSLIQAAILAQLKFYSGNSGLSIYGPQLLDYSVTNIGASPLFRDRITADISLAVPIALNKISITLVVP